MVLLNHVGRRRQALKERSQLLTGIVRATWKTAFREGNTRSSSGFNWILKWAARLLRASSERKVSVVGLQAWIPDISSSPTPEHRWVSSSTILSSHGQFVSAWDQQGAGCHLPNISPKPLWTHLHLLSLCWALSKFEGLPSCTEKNFPSYAEEFEKHHWHVECLWLAELWPDP